MGYAMVAYVEGAARAGYPTELLNLTRVVDLPTAVCALAHASTRRCLRAAALRAAALSSAQYSAHELLVALCELGSVCSPTRRLRLPSDAPPSTAAARARAFDVVVRGFCEAKEKEPKAKGGLGAERYEVCRSAGVA
jgi:hypothetical protein